MVKKTSKLFFGRSEFRELKKILADNETIEHLVYGFYNGGRGILVATNKRILLIDKRSFFVNVEEFMYGLLQSASLETRSMLSQITIKSPNSRLIFRTISDAKLRKMSDFITDCSVAIGTEADKISHMATFITSPYRGQSLRPRRHNIVLQRRRPIKFYSN